MATTVKKKTPLSGGMYPPRAPSVTISERAADRQAKLLRSRVNKGEITIQEAPLMGRRVPHKYTDYWFNKRYRNRKRGA